ncbi:MULTISPECIES: polyribonucleotide nucleotidyltransferase [unclassified Pseudodesulfovibrio]|uniref:polyribonucleotide nucleotidyltransferase n=1 Tax=unclassified Pseudodesulfovibrio TaxID=2661612 RepID=UPI000FEC171D|nr:MULTISPECIES: polyribonucleotide nucleotidyltransferase [unclassified Pseudodesulfovibrio]MCJ2163168.1 polyribonucleotide nucleotidyltransferase [Pseudodesulfovibrio sp. S3-i]RWU07157.1 polyribonucleotide nucleotidyltransferase [Pseudodesulfovibrio sp. S3]
MTMIPFDATSLTTTVGGIDITIETGKYARQASGAVTISSGNTTVLVTAVTQPLEIDRGFFPLTCNYQEMAYAAGRVPGNYFRREGRPSERETLVSRLIDRPIRPLFAKGFSDEVQIIATVLSADKRVNPDVLALTGASAACHISKMPFLGPIVGARVGYVDGEFVLYPTYKGIEERSSLNLIFAATRDAMVMVEGGGNFVSEDMVADALAWGHEQVAPLFDLQDALREKVGVAKLEVTAPERDEEVAAFLGDFISADLEKALTTPEKMVRYAAKDAAKQKAKEAVAAKFPEDETKLKAVGDIIGDMTKKIVRERIVKEGLRIDGRDTTTVRPLSIEVGMLQQTHGSVLFRRGETSALAVATLGSTRDEQRYDSLLGDATKRFMLHYNFPPYCVGEARMLRGTSRREVGHGALAERALTPVLPSPDDFPFTIRVVSEIMESNGSSSMASVCGATMSLMDAGVPISAPVAGIAMGLCKEGDQYFVLTDILGDEDALGDMDFKVAGTKDGITAIQMDIKIAGIPPEVLKKALYQAKEARTHILDHMAEVLENPRPELSTLAPQMAVVHIDPEKIRSVIGPGGKNIKAITAETEADIDIEDSGKISIFAPTLASMEKAKEMVLYYDQKPEPGKNYLGTVRKVLEVGALVEILPGLEGMLHISQLDFERVERVEDVVQLGQEVWVKCISLEPGGRIRLSRKAWLMEEAGQEVNLEEFKRPAPRDGDRGPRRDSRGPRRDSRGGGRDRR